MVKSSELLIQCLTTIDANVVEVVLDVVSAFVGLENPS